MDGPPLPLPDPTRPGARAADEVVGRGRGLAVGGVGCLAMIGFVLALSRPPLPTTPTVIALLAQAAACLWLARTRPSRARSVALVATAALTAVTGWYFGPLSAFAGVVALVLVIAGLATETPAIPRAVSWAIGVALAGGQLVVFGLVVAGVLADRSLVPVHLPGHPTWHFVLALLAVQGLYVGAFAAGRAAARRYRRLLDDLDAAARDVLRQDALLAEARADYARAVEIARRGAVAPVGPRAVGPSAGDETAGADTVEQPSVATIDDRTAAAPPAAALPPSPTEEPWLDHAQRSWDEAYQDKMRQQDAAALVLCAGGAVLLGLVTRSPSARVVAWVALAGIVAAFAVRRALLRRHPSTDAYGPWVVVAALGVGPAYAWGVHTAFAAVFTTLLFAGGLFRAPRARTAVRNAVVAAVMLSHGLLFALTLAGVVPDVSNLPLRDTGEPAAEPYVEHAFLQLSFVVAFVAGLVVDRRFGDAFRRVDAARHEVVRREAMLRETRAEIDAALRQTGSGLFTGTTVHGHAIGRLLGRGGMGEVYEAIDPRGARVALKLLRGDRAGDPAALARFTAEADVLTRVASPYVARVLSVGRDVGELPFIAMAYVEGRSLAHLLEQRAQLSTAAVASLVRDVARGLQDVHAAGFVHLDVKPSNILLTEALEMASRWCLVDFGVARLARAAASDAVAGTPQYMAPEQALGGAVDARSDLYALSLVVYRALTGRPAYAGADRRAIAAAAATSGPPDPRRHASIHEDVGLVLRVGLAADPRDRWASALELRAAFDQAFAGSLSEDQRARARTLLERFPWSD